ncbi:hypothetical protein CVT25_003456 [Psilocybe cyanescens]|uniref:RRM domain-containing protein n=1 Tax=Psilocybe cyanescens TaxID=93625 RepID=A0A409WM22_PSICY|nr:hypothetical protein CVT25_003456 [Psilocybe cyanescens]
MRYACPGSTIIEENPQPAPFTDRAVPSVPQRGRWVCPGSTIIEETSQPTASTSKAAPIKAKRVNFNATDKSKGKGPLKPAQRATKKEHIIDARKKEQLRHKLALDRNPTNFVFVGNLELKMTEADLRHGFADCGYITRVIFRCSQGCPHPPKEDEADGSKPHGPASLRDRMYATVEFRNFQSVKKALKCNGKVITGQQAPIKVCASAADLPEVQEIANYYIKKMKSDSMPKPPTRWFKPKSTLVRHPTEVFIDFTKAGNDKFRIMRDFSFPKSIL